MGEGGGGGGGGGGLKGEVTYLCVCVWGGGGGRGGRLHICGGSRGAEVTFCGEGGHGCFVGVGGGVGG